MNGVPQIGLRPNLDPEEKLTAAVDSTDLIRASRMYSELTGRELLPSRVSWSQRLDGALGGRLIRWGILMPGIRPDSGICYHRDGRFSAQEIKEELEVVFRSAGLTPVPEGRGGYRLVRLDPGPAVVSTGKPAPTRPD